MDAWTDSFIVRQEAIAPTRDALSQRRGNRFAFTASAMTSASSGRIGYPLGVGVDVVIRAGDRPALELARGLDPRGSGLVHRDDKGGQYVSIRCTGASEAGIEPSVGSVGDSGTCPRSACSRVDPAVDPRDNALAETVIGLFKAEMIQR